MAALGVPGYANHGYNVINFAFYLTSTDTMAEASHVWQNPSTYFSSTYRDSITNKFGSNDADFRSSVKRMSCTNLRTNYHIMLYFVNEM